MLELQGYLSGKTRVPGVHAVPGKGSNVPLYILGSSLFGAQLAAALGLPYAFASHFAPAALEEAVAVYRDEFRPSEQLGEPYVIAGVNVIAADTTAAAQEQQQAIRRTARDRPVRAVSAVFRPTSWISPTSKPTSCWKPAWPRTSTRCSPTRPSAHRRRSANTSTSSVRGRAPTS